MTWETATIIGSVGVSFYLLYLKTLLSDEHESLKLGLMLFSWWTILIGLGHIVQIIIESAGAATENIALAELYYQVWVYVGIGFTAYWFIFLAGRWITSWLERR